MHNVDYFDHLRRGAIEYKTVAMHPSANSGISGDQLKSIGHLAEAFARQPDFIDKQGGTLWTVLRNPVTNRFEIRLSL
jgi:hypothetical protein